MSLCHSFSTLSVACFVSGKCPCRNGNKEEWKVNCRCCTLSANFSQLSVFWEKIVVCFRSHVTCRFYPLEGLVQLYMWLGKTNDPVYTAVHIQPVKRTINEENPS